VTSERGCPFPTGFDPGLKFAGIKMRVTPMLFFKFAGGAVAISLHLHLRGYVIGLSWPPSFDDCGRLIALFEQTRFGAL
jgi:hypothetical protein